MKKRISYPILIFLLVVTIFQSFMLINYHSTGQLLPKRSTFNPNTVTNVMQFEEYLLGTYICPAEITMTTGEGLNVQKVSKDPESYFTQIWRDTVDTLGSIADKKLYEIYDEDKWNDMTGVAGFIVKFGYDCPMVFINWITGAVNTNNQILSINKLMIIPINRDEGDIYIKSGDKVFRYIGVKLSGLLRQAEFLSIYKEIKENSEISYVYLNEVASYDNFKGNIQPDTTVIIMEQGASLKSIRVTGYELLTECIFNLQIEPNINNLSSLVKQYIADIKARLFGVYADVYKEVIAQNRELTFSDQYNVYSLHLDGSVTYRYSTAAYDQEKGDISQAFNNTLEMLTNLTSLSTLKQDSLVLSKVEVLDDSYTFSFTYYFNDYPVILKDKKHCVTINATADRVLSVDADLFDITDASLGNDDAVLYDLRTFNMLAEADMALGSLKADNMYIAYVKDNNIVLPASWIIEYEGITPLVFKEALSDGF